MTPSLTSLLWFVAVLAAIPVVLWLLRQSPLGRLHGLRPGAPECPMRTLASHALSPNQKVVTVEVGLGLERRWLVLGVTPSSISTLHQFAPAVAPATAPATAAAPWLHPHGLHATAMPAPPATPPVLEEVVVPGEVARAADSGERDAAVRPFGELLARLRRRPQAAPVSDTSFADTCPSRLFDDEPEATRA